METVAEAKSGLIRRVVSVISRTMAVLSAALVLVITVIIVADVSRRYLTGRSIPGVIEYSEVLMVAVVFLGLAFAQRNQDHIGVDLFLSKLPRRAGQFVKAVGLVIVSGSFLWMLWETGKVAQRSYETGEHRFGLAQVPIWPARIVITVGVFFLLVEIFFDIADLLRGRDPRVSIREVAGTGGAAGETTGRSGI